MPLMLLSKNHRNHYLRLQSYNFPVIHVNVNQGNNMTKKATLFSKRNKVNGKYINYYAEFCVDILLPYDSELRTYI